MSLATLAVEAPGLPREVIRDGRIFVELNGALGAAAGQPRCGLSQSFSTCLFRHKLPISNANVERGAGAGEECEADALGDV